MPSFDQNHSKMRDGLQNILPRLYKFAIVLAANEQLARALLRGTCRLLNGGRGGHHSGSNDPAVDAMRRMNALWTAKTSEDPSLQMKNPPDVHLFSKLPLRGGLAGHAHFAKFIANLPSQQRAALYLVYGENASYDEAAEFLSLSVHGLMKLLARSHTALGQWLDHRGYSENEPAIYDDEPVETAPSHERGQKQPNARERAA